jgi:hypothetical protein
VAPHTSNPGYAVYLSPDVQGCRALCLDKRSNISQVLCTITFLDVGNTHSCLGFLDFILKAEK